MKKILLTFALLSALFCCTENTSKNKALIENAVDETDSSLKGSFGSSRYDNNIIDKVYSELIRHDHALALLDEKILRNREESEKVLQSYRTVLDKSDSFYRDAGLNAGTVTDSLLKKQIGHEIRISSDQYKLDIQKIKSLISRQEDNLNRLNDLYTAFKIRKTLPEIEKYQKAHPLKPDSLGLLIRKQERLINELTQLKQ